MPELPEIQAHAERLTHDFGGTTLVRFEPLTFTALKTAAPDPAGAVGLTLGSVGRRGKYLLLRFTTQAGDRGAEPDGLTFVIHLMQGGRLVPDEKLSRKPRGGIARWRLTRGGEDSALLLTEAGKERKAGVWVCGGDPSAAAPGHEPAPLERLGPDADTVSFDDFSAALGAKNQRVHGFLRDQHGIAGMGRMLANEICHRAKMSPFAMTAKLTDEQRRSLYDAMGSCIADALAFERTLDAMSRSADRPGAVHRRKGATCPVCGDTVRAVEYNAYEVDYCATCQTDGRVLADNTTSRFLK